LALLYNQDNKSQYQDQDQDTKKTCRKIVSRQGTVLRLNIPVKMMMMMMTMIMPAIVAGLSGQQQTSAAAVGKTKRTGRQLPASPPDSHRHHEQIPLQTRWQAAADSWQHSLSRLIHPGTKSDSLCGFYQWRCGRGQRGQFPPLLNFGLSVNCRKILFLSKNFAFKSARSGLKPLFTILGKFSSVIEI